jgi:hypothetical protein
MSIEDSVGQKLLLDTQLVDVYLTGLQAEIEAKLRAVANFRTQMQKIDATERRTDLISRLKAARALIDQARLAVKTN